MSKIRILVVDDSLTIRKHLVELLGTNPHFEVVGEAEDGRQAIEMCLRLRPDVMTLDMVLPVMSGTAVTEYLMAFCPTPIVIVSASTNRGELFKTYDALAAGAVEVVEKPNENSPRDWETKLMATIKVASRIKVITHPRGRLRGDQPATTHDITTSMASHSLDDFRCVVMGASTGGPRAIATILSGLAPDFPLPILLVLHISNTFALSFSSWLAEQSSIPVVLAEDGSPLPPRGQPLVVLAPADRHLVIRNQRMWLTSDRELHSCRPSVDMLFESAAAEFGRQTIGVLLTGMGRDGANGLLALRKAGGLTIAQDEASCTVFGMPREAIALGAAQSVVPLDEIATALNLLAFKQGNKR